MEKNKVTFLLDKKNNWLESFILNSTLIKDNDKYNVNISHNHLEVQSQDIVFILGNTKIFNDNFLESNKLNLVIHESALPKGKGFAPVQWQILEGAKFIPVCLIEATNEVDSGDIIYRDKIELSGFELYEEIRKKQAEATIRIISKFLDIYPAFNREKQSGSDSFYRKRGINDGKLDIDKSIRQQFNILRIGNNEVWPSFFYYEGKKYLLKIYSE
jgi:methionyl-tRNA formyltransferase